MSRIGYIELVLPKSSKKELSKIVNRIVPEKEMYYSDVVKRISGDVTDKAHFTVFFGLNENQVENKKLHRYLRKNKVKSLKPHKLSLFDGYQGLYKVLTLEVDDSDKKLENLSNSMLKFEHNKEVLHSEFKPHITLAYVQNTYQIPENFKFDSDLIYVRDIRVSS